MKADVKKFAGGFSVIYWITILSNILGNYAYLAATPNKREAFHIGWSLSLGELGFVFALLAGLVIGNFFPGLARYLSHAAKPEWYIKTGIVILGPTSGSRPSVPWAWPAPSSSGGCALWWKLSDLLAGGVFCGPEILQIHAGMGRSHGFRHLYLRGGCRHCHRQRHQGRQIIPTILASVIIVFVAVELLILPFAAAYFLPGDPDGGRLLAGAWW